MTRIGGVLIALASLAALMWSAAAIADDALDRALSLTKEQRYEEARDLLDPLLEREPDNVRVRLLHGALRVHEGDTEDAIGIFRAITRDHPDMFEAYNNLAVLYVKEGRLEEARVVMLDILERRDEALGYENLGGIYTLLARRAYDRGRELRAAGATSEDGSVTPEPPEPPSPPVKEAEPPAVPDRPAREAADADEACVVAGAFGDPASLEEAEQWLLAQDADILGLARETRETFKNHIVYLPPLESRAEAEEKVREIRARGVSDVGVIPTGALANGVSFGVYGRKANLERRMTRLGELGYAVRSAGYATATEELMAIEARIGGTAAALSEAWAARFPEHPIREMDCR